MFHHKPFCYNHISPGFFFLNFFFNLCSFIFLLHPIYIHFFIFSLSFFLVTPYPSFLPNTLTSILTIVFSFHSISYSLTFTVLFISLVKFCFHRSSLSLLSSFSSSPHPSNAYHANPTLDIADVSTVSQH